MCNEQHTLPQGKANSDLTFFHVRAVYVRKGKCKRIEKNRRRLRKRYLMLPKVSRPLYGQELPMVLTEEGLGTVAGKVLAADKVTPIL